jgi:hypothetical protein
MEIMYSGKEPVGFDSGGKQTYNTDSHTSTVPLVVSAVHRSIQAGVLGHLLGRWPANTREPRGVRGSLRAQNGEREPAWIPVFHDNNPFFAICGQGWGLSLSGQGWKRKQTKLQGCSK